MKSLKISSIVIMLAGIHFSLFANDNVNFLNRMLVGIGSKCRVDTVTTDEIVGLNETMDYLPGHIVFNGSAVGIIGIGNEIIAPTGRTTIELFSEDSSEIKIYNYSNCE